MVGPGEIVLKKGKERAVLNRHPWIFAGAIEAVRGGSLDGSLVAVMDHRGEFLGTGYYNSLPQIAVRMLAFDREPVDRGFFREKITASLRQRSSDPSLASTDSYRLIYSESDGIPGLVVDRYRDNLVMQIFTRGMEAWKGEITGILAEECRPVGIYERSDHAGRALEGMVDAGGDAYGTTPDELEILENGARFLVDPKTGQKTGFFLDQRENRRIVRAHAGGRRVLNLFSYTGGFTVAALMGGARSVVSVDTSEASLSMLKRNLGLNGISGNCCEVRENAFEYARHHSGGADFIIIDPPALVKKKGDMEKGARAYKDINMHIFRNSPPGSLVLTCSCSRFVDAALFQKIVYSAMLDAGRSGKILYRGGHPSDHPVSLYHPESEYLKSLLIYVE